MSEHPATVAWSLDDGDFLKGRYSRAHTWTFDGGVTVQASTSPGVVPAPFADPSHVDPEEALVAAVASCHMLTFLYIAATAGIVVEKYVDNAVGHLVKNDAGRYWVGRVDLYPQIQFRGDKIPTPEEIAEMHHDTHSACFIANSVRSEIVVNEVELG